MKRELGMLVLAGAAGTVAIVAILQWLSWHWLSHSGRYVSELAATGWIEEEREWHRHHEALRARRALVPLNSGLYWQLGELHRWRAAGMVLWPEQQERELAAAKEQYHRAVIRSPHNGELLARVAFRLAYADDRSAIPVMRRAMDIAPYEPVVQYYLADVGFRYWDQLDADDKRSFAAMLSHAMTRAKLAAQIKRMAGHHGRLNLLVRLAEMAD